MRRKQVIVFIFLSAPLLLMVGVVYFLKPWDRDVSTIIATREDVESTRFYWSSVAPDSFVSISDTGVLEEELGRIINNNGLSDEQSIAALQTAGNLLEGLKKGDFDIFSAGRFPFNHREVPVKDGYSEAMRRFASSSEPELSSILVSCEKSPFNYCVVGVFG